MASMTGVAAFALLTTPGNAIIDSLMWAGVQRQYYMYVPPKPPTGLIVALSPDEIDGVQFFCESAQKGIGEVGPQTGAIVVCPAAQVYNNDGPGHPGGPNPCWKSFVSYGYCTGGRETEDSEDVDFLEALIDHVKQAYDVPEGRTIMSGLSNGGSGAYRFNCEKSEMIDGLVIGIQSWFDPWVGYYDYVNDMCPTGRPQCSPKKQVPLYSADGHEDPLYGQPPCHSGFETIENWQGYSSQILGCSGEMAETSRGPHQFPTGTATCYEYPSCPGITGAGLNVACSVPNMGHDGSILATMLPAAFADFFGVDPVPTPTPTPSPSPLPTPASGECKKHLENQSCQIDFTQDDPCYYSGCYQCADSTGSDCGVCCKGCKLVSKSGGQMYCDQDDDFDNFTAMIA